MAGKICDEGEYRALDILFGTQVVDGILYLGLYKNATELPDDTVLGDLMEVSGFGYARKELTRGNWVLDTTLGVVGASYIEHIFYADGGAWGDVYGCFIATSSDNSGMLFSLDHFANSYEIEDGKGLRVTPIVQLD